VIFYEKTLLTEHKIDGCCERFTAPFIEFKRVNDVSVMKFLGLPFFKKVGNLSVLLGVNWNAS